MPGTAIFDLDRTVTRRGTWTRFVIFANRTRPGRLLALPRLAATGAAEAAGLLPALTYKRRSLRLLAGMDRAALVRAAEAFAAREAVSGLRPGALRAIAGHRARGDRLILATACVDVLGEAFGRALGFDAVVATPTAPPDAGQGRGLALAGANCQGAEKLRRIREILAPEPSGRPVHAYSDHVSDLPLLLWADHGFAVNPSRALRRAARARAIPVLDFDA